MAIGDKAYRDTVPSEAQQLATERGLGQANWFIPGADAPPYFPDSVRSIFARAVPVVPPSSDQQQSE